MKRKNAHKSKYIQFYSTDEKQYRHESRLVAFGNFPHSIFVLERREKKTSFYTKFNFKCAFRIANANCTSATTNLRRNIRIMSVCVVWSRKWKIKLLPSGTEQRKAERRRGREIERYGTQTTVDKTQ